MRVGVSESYLGSLNTAQIEAVKFQSSKALQIIAGPGTGKTKVLTARFAYLVLDQGLPAESVIMTTFTRKAAEEMKERLLPLLISNGISPHGLKIGTFHSICWKLLREKGYLIGKDKFDRATPERIKLILDEIILEMPDQIRDYACTKSYKNEVSLCRMKDNQWQVHPDMILKRIAELKADAITPEKYEQRTVHDEALLYFYQQYQAKLSHHNLIDFDDVMLYAHELLSRHKVWRKVKHVLVDEFQDTNLLQIHLIFQLARGSHHISEGLTVVGDPDQGIYGFRSALSHNFQTMIELCPIEYHQIVLKENYRSAQSILDVSETVIKQQKRGRDNRLPLHAQFALDNKPVFTSFPSAEIEAYTIAKELIYLKSIPDLFSYKDFAILLRLRRSIRLVENALIAHKIPYVIQKGHTFWELKECRAIIRYMSVVCNEDDWDAIKKTINYPSRGVGDSSISKLAIGLERACAENKNISAFEFITKISDKKIDIGINVNAITGIKDYVNTITTIRSLFSMTNSNAGKDVLDDAFEKLYVMSGLKSLYKSNPDLQENATTGKELYRHKNIVNVKNYFGTFKIPAYDDEKLVSVVNLIEFAREFIGFTDLYTFKDAKEDEEIRDEHNIRDAVVLSTIHASKGLEWPVVFVPQCVEGLLPSYYRDSGDFPVVDQESQEEQQGQEECIPKNEHDLGSESQDELNENKQESSPSKKKSRISFSEERRMFFVSLTRAKYLLYISTVEQEGECYRSRFLKDEVIDLCDDSQACFNNVESLFKLHYGTKVQIPNQDRISYQQLVKDYHSYTLSNKQFLFWKGIKHSHTDLPATSENTNGILTSTDHKNHISSALPRVMSAVQMIEHIPSKPAEVIIQTECYNLSLDSPTRNLISVNPSPKKMPPLTREQTKELEELLSENEFETENSVKREDNYTAAEILHNPNDRVVDNRPIITNAKVLASAIKRELDSDREESFSDLDLSSGMNPTHAKPSARKGSKKVLSKRSSKKVKKEMKQGNDILAKLSQAKLRREEWDGEIIDLRSSQ